jgi:hypothetical protein
MAVGIGRAHRSVGRRAAPDLRPDRSDDRGSERDVGWGSGSDHDATDDAERSSQLRPGHGPDHAGAPGADIEVDVTDDDTEIDATDDGSGSHPSSQQCQLGRLVRC